MQFCRQIQLGNKILVYISSCLAGHAYPSGTIADEDVAHVKDAVLNCVTALHTCQPTTTEPAYPHLRTLLSFDTREFFNVLSLAFDDATDMTRDKKQRIVDILLLLMVDSVGFSPAQVITANYLCLVFTAFPPLDNIRVMVIVWRLTVNIIRTALWWIV